MTGTAPLRVLLAGGTGYVGTAVAKELARRGHQVLALMRNRHDRGGAAPSFPSGVEPFVADLLGDAFVERLAERRFDAVVSCMGSRTGVPADAWAVDHRAHSRLLALAKRCDAQHFVLLSAICVQKPLLAFQHAKLAFEAELRGSGLNYSIVRPTAYFKSLAGQIGRVQQGKAFLVFGDGKRTACKPISRQDLARFIADCLQRDDRRNAILPVGGPGEAITPIDQGQLLFELTGRPARFRHVPTAVFGAAIAALFPFSRLSARARAKAELARIGRYYATESMLVWDPKRRAYRADQTPSYGKDTLAEFYRRVLNDGLGGHELGDHRLF